MLKVRDARVIGVIVGSMGLSAEGTREIVSRLRLIITSSGRKCYTFSMGRLNAAKLANFPEVDLFVLIGNDDVALVPAK
jgi:diphthamide biosynthesis protein 2